MTIHTAFPEDFAGRSFDYLIVGGGTAGLVVAARLSENSNTTVGVIEAGLASFDTLAINVPGRYGESLGSHDDWQFETVHQSGLNGRTLPWPRGKVLGGTSALNFMTWNRPNREDLDAWKELGNYGWGWSDLLPFYRKSENFIPPSTEHQERFKSYHDTVSLGSDGPVPIIYTKEYSVAHTHWHETLNGLEIATNKAHMSGSNVGVWTNLVSVDPKTTTRAYSATSYYLPNAARKNLHVMTEASAEEIVLERHGQEWQAKSVRYKHHGIEYVVSAKREVIVSAGSVTSPQLLELSGIGNPSVLQAAGVTVKVENVNVGENLQEHMMTASIYEVDPSTPSPDDLKTDPSLAAAADKAFESDQSGPRSMLPCSICYLPLSHFVPEETLRSISTRSEVQSQRDKVLTRRFSDKQELGQIEYIFDIGNWSPFMPSLKGKKYGTMLQILQYPFSRGSIHIPVSRNGNPVTSADKPVIDPKYYIGPSGELDLEVQELCLRYGQKIASAAPLSKLVQKQVWPTEEENGDLQQWLLDNTITDWHPVGTCAMGGAEGAKGGVVDERLRVYGVKGLRVVDASIMPLQVSAHSQATVYAIAEKASQMILEDNA